MQQKDQSNDVKSTCEKKIKENRRREKKEINKDA